MSLTAFTRHVARVAFRCMAFGVFCVTLTASAAAQDSVIVGPPDDPYVMYSSGTTSTWDDGGATKGEIRPAIDTVNITAIDPSRFPEICASVEVLDTAGNPLGGLDLDSFCVWQDGVRIDSFTVVATPIEECFTSIALVIDISGSMESGGKLDSAKAAAKAFVRQMDIFDRVAIVTFSDCFMVAQDFTSDTALLISSIDALIAGGFTAAFDGIWKGVDITTTEFGTKAVIALSDGMENRSWLCTGGESGTPDGLLDGFADDSTLIVGLAKGAGIPIYTISLGGLFDPQYLQALAAGSGGFYSHAPTAAEIRSIYEEIKFRLCSRYLICYTSPDTIPNGDCHTLKICQQEVTGACVNCDTSVYCEPGPPEITVTVSPECHPAGTNLEICATVIDSDTPADELDVKLFYRLSDLDPYTSVAMSWGGGSNFCYTIPGALLPCTQDSVQFYVTASDGRVTVADPAGAPLDHHAIGICKGAPPECRVPSDTTIFQCDPTEVCLPVGCFDPDGNLLSGPTLISGPGTVGGGVWCYTPFGNDTVDVTIECRDDCGLRCEASFRVIFDMNDEPFCEATSSTTAPNCVPPIHVVTFQTTDADGDSISCVLYGDGVLGDGYWEVTDPAPGQTVSARIVCTDPCGDSCALDIAFTFPNPEPPLCEFPESQTVTLCEPRLDSFPVFATGGAVCELQPPSPGLLRNGYWVYEPQGSEVVDVWVICAAECDTCEGRFTITYEVNLPPVLTCGEPLVYECDNIGSFGSPLVQDENRPTVQLDSTHTILPGGTDCDYLIAVRWIAIDECGAADTCTREVRIRDTRPPVLDCPLDTLTMDCDNVVAPSPPTATDNCDPNPTVNLLGIVDTPDPECVSGFERIVRWEAIDRCGNADTCEVTIFVIDTTPPVIECPDPITSDCDIIVDPFAPPATDNCDPSPRVAMFGSERIPDPQCPNAYELRITWEAIDTCGNRSTCIQSIFYIDTTPPVIACPPPDTLECAGDAALGTPPISPPPATDNCGGPPVMTQIDVVRTDGSCPQQYQIDYYWEAMDECGNADTCIQTFVFIDTVPPEFTFCPPDLPLECSDTRLIDPTAQALGWPTAIDLCSPVVIGLVRVDTLYGPDSCSGTFTIRRQWTATDDCGNESDTCVQTLFIEDFTPPELVLPPDTVVYCADTNSAGYGWPSVTDDCDPAPTVTLLREDILPGLQPCEGSYDIQRIFIGADDCGNRTGEYIQVIHIVDTLPPVLTCPPDTTVECNEIPSGPLNGEFGVATAVDECDPNPIVRFLGEERFELPCGYEIHRSYDAIDWCGKQSAPCTQVITVTDTTAPICEVPNDTSFYFCLEQRDICLPVGGTDNCDPLPTCILLSDRGTLEGGQWCYRTGQTDETFYVVVECQDLCGNVCVDSFMVDIHVDQRPDVVIINPGTIYACSTGAEICIDYTVSDPDGLAGLIESLYFDSSVTPVTIDTAANTVCFTATSSGQYYFAVAAQDSCGHTDTAEALFNVEVNEPPVCLPPNDTAFFVCDYGDVISLPMTARDTDLDSCWVTAGPGAIDGDTWSWAVDDTGRFCVDFACVDSCGQVCYDVVCFTVHVNSAPVCYWPDDTTLTYCEEDTLCVLLLVEDIDGNLDACYYGFLPDDGSKTLYGGNICFARPAFDTTLTIVAWCVDSCGAECIDTFTVNLLVNEPPVCEVPNDTTIFLCEPTEVCLPISVTDPDGNLLYCEILGDGCKSPDGCTAIGDTAWCYYASVNETVEVIVRCVDSCNAVCETSFLVTFVVNRPPVCEVPADTFIFLCNSGEEISLPIGVIDPDGNFDSCWVSSGPGWIDNGAWHYAPTVNGEVCVEITCIDNCGLTCGGSFCVAIRINEPPFVEAPVDTAWYFICKPGDTICLGPWPQIDFDHNIMDRFVNFGWMDPPSVCFIADTAGTYIIDDCLRDSCGYEHCDTAYIIVELNTPPVCEVPSDTTISLCEPGTISLPVGATDADGNLTGCTIGDSPGELVEGFWVYTPTENDTVCVQVWCFDECETSCTDSFCVTFEFNQPPVCPGGLSQTIVQCTPTEVRLPFVATDPNGDPVTCRVVQGVGSIQGGAWVYTPTGSEQVCVVVECTDACGATCRTEFCITFAISEPPICDLPGDTVMELCSAQTACLPVGLIETHKTAPGTSGGDIRRPGSKKGRGARRGDYAPNLKGRSLAECRVISGPGTISNGNWCYTPSGDESVSVTVECIDTCGAVCEGSFSVTFIINEPPVCELPTRDTTFFFCQPSEICIPVGGSDPDGNLSTCFIVGDDGEKGEIGPAGLQWCYFADHDTTIDVPIRCVDKCGAYCEDTLRVTIVMNEPPVCEQRNDTTIFLCEPADVCFDYLGAGDPDGNFSYCTLLGDDKIGGLSWCYFVVVEETVEFIVRCYDSCGLFCQDAFLVTFAFNDPPSFAFDEQQDFYLCDPGQVCIGYTPFDTDGLAGLTEQLVNGPAGATIDTAANTVCFTPVGDSGGYDIVVKVTDECGETYSESLHVVVRINRAPVCQFLDIVEPPPCPQPQIPITIFFTSIDPDGDPVTCSLIGDGQLGDGFWQIDAPAPGDSVDATIICEDECGDACTLRIAFRMPNPLPPVCEVPEDQTRFLCGLVPDSLPVTAIGGECGLIEDSPGMLRGGWWVYTPAGPGPVSVTILCEGECETCSGSFTITYEINEPPVCDIGEINSPLCTPPEHFIPFTSTDPEGGDVTCRLDGPGALTEAGWTYTPTPGDHVEVRIVCTDACGDSCEVSWVIDFPARVPPTCNLPGDTTVIVCPGSSVSLPVSAGEGATCQKTAGPGVLAGGYWSYTPGGSETVNVSILCISESGCDSCSGSFAVTFEELPPPTISFDGGDAQSVFLCEPGAEICLPFAAADAFGGGEYAVRVVSGPGTVNAQNSTICFTPEGAGSYTIIAQVEDACSSSRDTVTVTVDANTPPVCSVPNDTTIVVCDSTEVCLPITASDADGNLVGCTLTDTPGVLDEGLWCYTPTSSGQRTVTVTCTDECGATCTESFTVTFDVQGSVPICSVPNDTSILLCASTQICLPFSVTDADDGEVTCEIVSGPGALVDGQWCYTPTADEEVTVTIRCTDPCGLVCEGTFTILIDINDPPSITLPEEITVSICGPGEVCVPFTANDPNGNLDTCLVVTGPGRIVGNTWCYTPSGDETVDVRISCIDECGASQRRWMRVNIDRHGLPVCNLPPDQSIILCEPGDLCLTFSEGDPAVNGITCTVLDGVGEIRGNQWCTNVTGPGDVTVTLQCVNPCGDKCTITRTYSVEIDPGECGGTGPASVAPETGTILIGDLNRDGVVDVLDVVILANHIYRRTGNAGVTTAAVSIMARADVNCDGRVNEADLVYLSAFVFRSGDAPCAGAAATDTPRERESGIPQKDKGEDGLNGESDNR